MRKAKEGKEGSIGKCHSNYVVLRLSASNAASLVVTSDPSS